MRPFFFISIFFHGIILMLLFSWEIPLADKLLPRNIIQVSLVEKVEEEGRGIEKAIPKPREERKLAKRTASPPPAKKEEDKKEKPREAVKEEEIKKKDEIRAEEKPLPNKMEPALEPLLKVASQTSGNPGGENSGGPGGEIRKAGLTEGTGTFFEASLNRDAGKEGIDLGGGEERASLPGGDGGKPDITPSPPSLQEGDPVLLQIMRRIEAAKRYPKTARRMGIEGKTVIRFKLKPGGQVEAVEIVESSGSEILDKASLETVREAAPLPYKEGWLKVGIVFKIL
jgi:TonB family protein